ncbi:hypothetical protein ACOYR4_18480 [Acidovorax sp. M14]|uniref:hypothetical protein n=1 Tax=Acidovorax sp. M14 TaxID=3411354 RepID=UPI003BF4AEBD
MVQNAKSAPVPVKPAKLQVNTAGAWKDVARFDVADEAACAAVMNAARDIGFYATHDVRFRVVRDDALNEPLMTWTKQDGWKEWRHAGR